MSDKTYENLSLLAEQMSTPERKISPMQVAAQLLEDALGNESASAPKQTAKQRQRKKRRHRIAAGKKEKG